MDITEINELIRTLDTFINIAKYIGIGAISQSPETQEN